MNIGKQKKKKKKLPKTYPHHITHLFLFLNLAIVLPIFRIALFISQISIFFVLSNCYEISSISDCGVWRARIRVQVFRREFHTHIHLD